MGMQNQPTSSGEISRPPAAQKVEAARGGAAQTSGACMRTCLASIQCHKKEEEEKKETHTNATPVAALRAQYSASNNIVQGKEPERKAGKTKSRRELSEKEEHERKEEDEKEKEKERNKIKYWHYKQTGIRSRPIKLLKHPIEHIERKIIITCLLSFLFKLIAILTGPVIVLIVYLITVPFTLGRHLIWFLLNLRCLTNAQIKTTCRNNKHNKWLSWSDEEQSTNGQEEERESSAQEANGMELGWKYCPLSYLESYWFKERLINTVILVIDNNIESGDAEFDKVDSQIFPSQSHFSIDKFKSLIRDQVLVRPLYKKFLSRVISRGIPFYKSHYWHYLGLDDQSSIGQSIQSNDDEDDDDDEDEDDNDEEADNQEEDADRGERSGENNESRAQISDRDKISTQANHSHPLKGEADAEAEQDKSSQQFSTTSGSYSSAHEALEQAAARRSSHFSKCEVRISMPPPPQAASSLSGSSSQRSLAAAAGKANKASQSRRSQSDSNSSGTRVDLRSHIFIDHSLSAQEEGPLTSPSAESGAPAAAKAITLATIRRHAYHLMEIAGLASDRPLWEMRVIPSKMSKKTYLIFRCHQCLADGKSLSKLLTEHLTLKVVAPAGGGEERAKESNKTTQQQGERGKCALESEEEETILKPLREKRSFIERLSKSNSLRGAIFVGPLTVLLWCVWTFTRRCHNHLKRCKTQKRTNTTTISCAQEPGTGTVTTFVTSEPNVEHDNNNNRSQIHEHRRLYMTHYDLTKFFQIKQMTRSTASDIILCGLSGAMREYLRKFNGVSNPPNLVASLAVDMHQPEEREQRRHVLNTKTTKAQQTEEAQVNCTLVNVSLPISIEGTVPRLWEIRNTMDELRTSADPWVMIGLKKFLFKLLPNSLYCWFINYISLRNSSAFVSNLHGPATVVESWCVDLFQRALWEAQQEPGYKLISDSPAPSGVDGDQLRTQCQIAAQKVALARRKLNRQSRLTFKHNLGSLKAIYYCMEPPTSDIPISFNCITYHNKLFVSSMSRSLLVEDSKLLIKLFFRQLDQLANTIAKRRSLITIIRSPAGAATTTGPLMPIEISCQPASPVGELDEEEKSDKFLVMGIEGAASTLSREEKQPELLEESFELEAVDKKTAPDEPHRNSVIILDKQSSVANEEIKLQQQNSTEEKPKRGRDDLEVNLEGRKVYKCPRCQQVVCSCRRRKSLFSFDQSKPARAFSHVINQLHPSRSIIVQSLQAPKNESMELSTQQLDSLQNDCTCNQLFFMDELEEDEANAVGSADEELTTQEAYLSGSSRTPSARSINQLEPTSHQFHRHSSTPRPPCAKSHSAERSSLSLNLQSNQEHQYKQQQQHRQQQQQQIRGDQDSGLLGAQHQEKSRRRSNVSMDEAKRRVAGDLCQLLVPGAGGSGFGTNSKLHSKSETDLLPTKSMSSQKQTRVQRGLADSWFNIRKRSQARKHSLVSRPNFSVNPQAQSSSTTNPKSRHFMEAPVDLIYRHFGDQSKRRRRSLASSASTSQARSVVIKDEINADVNLRCNLDSSFFNIRNRRFSNIGSAIVGNQRRTSLIPFGLMHNNSFPKLFSDDNEAHL